MNGDFKIRNGVGIAVLFGAVLGLSETASAAVRCQLRLGNGCNGPVVYEIQLCAAVTFVQGQCVQLCQGVAPICNVSDFDAWVSAYDQKGRNGFKGDLAQTSAPDNYDQTGQLNATSGNSYTVCMSQKMGIIGGYSNPIPASAPKPCPTVTVASATNCTGGTVFNGDPTNPKCITKDSYCAGGGSAGNYVTTMNAGFQMVAVQNQHFVVAPGQDPNLINSAATAGSYLAGLTAPTTTKATGLLGAQSFNSSNSTGRSAGASNSGGGVGGTPALTGGGSADKEAATANVGANPSAFASKDFGLEGAAYGKGSGGGAGSAGGAGGGAGGSGGASWFGGGGGAALAGSAGEELGFENGGANGASRGLASDGSLKVEDPANYFLMSDVGTSLFKRVTAQFRKKERSLVLNQTLDAR